MEKGVAITGMGIISSIGSNVEENYQALFSGSHGIFYPKLLQTRLNHLPVGEVNISNAKLAEILKLPKEHSFTRAALLGAVAAKEAVLQSNLEPNHLKDTAFINASSVGGMDMTEKYFAKFPVDNTNRRFIQAQHPGFTTTQIANFMEMHGFVTTISTACSSSANAIMMGARMIKAGKVKRVVVGGTDCLTKFTLNGFNSLMILSAENCKPFDENRNGLNLGEGAAFLVLEAEEVLHEKLVLGRISGYGNANDAWHQTASSESGEGAFMAMEKALQSAGIVPAHIDHINAHGTATKNNDLSESFALKKLFERIPLITSTKAFTGHTLAAAGAIEAVYSLLSISRGQIFPTLNFDNPMQETGIDLVVKITAKNMSHVLSNSFGFGGNCTSLIFSKK